MGLKSPNFSGIGGKTVNVGTLESIDETSVAVNLGDDAGDDFIVDTNKLVVEGDTGKVGIGTAAPATTLDVSGGITATSGNDATGTIAVRSGDAAQYSKISMGTNANKATLGCAGATDTFFTGTAQDDLVIRADDNNSKVHIGAGTSGPAAMVVTEVANVGKVGIGTTSPGVQLDIQDITTSSANTGGALRLSANDGAAMGDSHRLGVIEFTGAEDAGGSQTVGARIEAMTDAAWSASENGAALYFYTTDGNASQSNALKLDSNLKATFAGDVTAQDITASGGGCAFGNGQAATIAVDAKTGTNATGNNLTITAGAGTGTGTPGIMTFQVPTVTGSGSGSQSQLNNMVLSQAGTSIYWGGLGALGNDEGVGEIAYFGTEDGSDTLAAGRLMYMDTSGVWKYCDADAVATGGTQLLAIALGAAVTDGLLLKGFFKLNSYVEGTWNEGLPCYVSEAASEIDFTAPSASADFVRVLGYAVDSTNVIYFNPSSTNIVIA